VLARVSRIVHNTKSPLPGVVGNPAIAEQARAELPAVLRILSHELGAHPFLAGERPTIADCTLFGTWEFGRMFGVESIAAHNLHRWHDVPAATQRDLNPIPARLANARSRSGSRYDRPWRRPARIPADLLAAVGRGGQHRLHKRKDEDASPHRSDPVAEVLARVGGVTERDVAAAVHDTIETRRRRARLVARFGERSWSSSPR
jgi:hypothetical protein